MRLLFDAIFDEILFGQEGMYRCRLQARSGHLAINRLTVQLHFEPRPETALGARLGYEIDNHDSTAGRKGAAELWGSARY